MIIVAVRRLSPHPAVLVRESPANVVALVREVASELLAVAADLRVTTVGVCGVARVERLLTIETSPLYGTRRDELRAELLRIKADLARGRLRDDRAQADAAVRRAYASTSPRRIA